MSPSSLPGPSIWAAVGTASLLASLVGLAMVPWMVRLLPATWFARAERSVADRLREHPVRTIAQNTLGLLLMAVGFALLFLPGQGILTMLLGLLLTDLPVRDRALGWLAQRPRIARSLQDMRHARGLPPFVGLPPSEGHPTSGSRPRGAAPERGSPAAGAPATAPPAEGPPVPGAPVP